MNMAPFPKQKQESRDPMTPHGKQHPTASQDRSYRARGSGSFSCSCKFLLAFMPLCASRYDVYIYIYIMYIMYNIHTVES